MRFFLMLNITPPTRCSIAGAFIVCGGTGFFLVSSRVAKLFFASLQKGTRAVERKKKWKAVESAWLLGWRKGSRIWSNRKGFAASSQPTKVTFHMDGEDDEVDRASWNMLGKSPCFGQNSDDSMSTEFRKGSGDLYQIWRWCLLSIVINPGLVLILLFLAPLSNDPKQNLSKSSLKVN